MAHHAHIRCTPMELDYDLSGVVKNATKYIINQEVGTVTFKPHFHIWIWTDDCEKTVRNHITSALKIPPGTKGKCNAYYICKYDKYVDPTPAYLCKDLSGSYGFVSSSGYTQDEIDEFVRIGRLLYGPGSAYYAKKNKSPAPPKVEESPPAPVKVVKERPSAWKDLNDAFADVWYDTPDEDRYIWDIPRICRWIKHRFLKNHQPIPAESNTRRWAYSLYAIYAKDVETEGMKAIEQIDSDIF